MILENRHFIEEKPEFVLDFVHKCKIFRIQKIYKCFVSKIEILRDQIIRCRLIFFSNFKKILSKQFSVSQLRELKPFLCSLLNCNSMSTSEISCFHTKHRCLFCLTVCVLVDNRFCRQRNFLQQNKKT